MSAPAALLLDPRDNVAVCCRNVSAGERVILGVTTIVAAADIRLGHKIACKSLAIGDEVVKYGMAIGSATAAINAGDWIHLHNMKSNYIAAHTRDASAGAP
jgi:(2R)-sulfolactate sulfo-lyase subunit alpha